MRGGSLAALRPAALFLCCESAPELPVGTVVGSSTSRATSNPGSPTKAYLLPTASERCLSTIPNQNLSSI